MPGLLPGLRRLSLRGVVDELEHVPSASLKLFSSLTCLTFLDVGRSNAASHGGKGGLGLGWAWQGKPGDAGGPMGSQAGSGTAHGTAWHSIGWQSNPGGATLVPKQSCRAHKAGRAAGRWACWLRKRQAVRGCAPWCDRV